MVFKTDERQRSRLSTIVYNSLPNLLQKLFNNISDGHTPLSSQALSAYLLFIASQTTPNWISSLEWVIDALSIPIAPVGEWGLGHLLAGERVRLSVLPRQICSDVPGSFYRSSAAARSRGEDGFHCHPVRPREKLCLPSCRAISRSLSLPISLALSLSHLLSLSQSVVSFAFSKRSASTQQPCASSSASTRTHKNKWKRCG